MVLAKTLTCNKRIRIISRKDCKDLSCTTHNIVIKSQQYDGSIHALLNAAESSITFTRPRFKEYKPRLDRVC